MTRSPARPQAHGRSDFSYVYLMTVKRISKSIKLCVGIAAFFFAIYAYSALNIADRGVAGVMFDTKLRSLYINHPQVHGNLASPETERNGRKNVLFLMSDDLRTQLNSYKASDEFKMFTPHLDALAGKSLFLERAYVQLSMCGPSRASILTGRRPDTTKVWTQKGYWRKVGGNFTTIPQYFKDNGYLTAGVGKVFHPRKASGKDDPLSWTEPYYHPPDKKYWRKLGVSWKSFTKAELKKMPHPDAMIAQAAKMKLRELGQRYKDNGTNFFLGVGFLKPHLPFAFPEEYLRLYPLENMTTAENSFVPRDYPEEAYFSPKELLSKADIAKLDFSGALNETLPEDAAKLLRRAYFACVSYIDHLAGEVMKELVKLDLHKNTVISFIGDHGWHLGENGRWGKHTTMEQGTHTPMMIHIPGLTDQAVRSKSIVEFVDLFPTLAEAAGLPPIPECPRNSTATMLCSEGQSLMRLVRNPELTINGAAISQHHLYKTPGMGYSIRTDRFRYTEWARVKRTKHAYNRYDYAILWDSLIGVELYDHRVDSQENCNVAGEETYKGHIRILRKKLHEQINRKIKNVQVPFD